MMDAPDLSGDRFLLITDQDRRGTILVVAIVCCIYCPLLLSLRAVSSLKHLGVNDILVTAAVITGMSEYIVVSLAVRRGLGRSFDEVDSSDAKSLGHLVVASEILYFVTLSLTKCSVATLCRRLFSIDMKRNLLVCDCVVAACAIWGFVSIVVILTNCAPAEQIAYQVPYCHNLGLRWTAIATLDAILEVALVGLAAYVVIPLQMRPRAKVKAFTSFLPRAFIIVFIVLGVRAIHEATRSRQHGVSLTKPTVYRQIQLIYAIVAAALPALNRSLRLFHSSVGGRWMKSNYSTTQSGGQSSSRGRTATKNNHGKEDVMLVNLDPTNPKLKQNSGCTASQIEGTDGASHLRSGHARTASAGQSIDADSRSNRSQSTDSQAKMIRIEKSWKVRHEPVSPVNAGIM